MRHVHEPLHTHLLADPGDPLGARHVHVLEGEVGRLEAAADEVDDDVGVRDGTADRVVVVEGDGAEEDLGERLMLTIVMMWSTWPRSPTTFILIIL